MKQKTIIPRILKGKKYVLSVVCHSCTEMEMWPNIFHRCSSWYVLIAVRHFHESSVRAIDVESPFRSVVGTLL